MRAVYLVGLYLVRHLQGVGQGLGVLREQSRHLLLALYELLLGVTKAPGVADVRIGSQADKPVVHWTVLAVDEMGVVGGDHLNAQLFGQFEYALVDYHLLAVHLVNLVIGLRRNAFHLGLVKHHLQIIILTKDAPVPFCCLSCTLVVPCHEVSGNLAGKAGGTADQVFMVFLQCLVGYAGPVVKSVDKALGAYLHQILVAVVVLGQENQVVVALVVVVLEMVVIVARNVYLAADQRLDYGLLVRPQVRLVPGPFEELLDTVHVTVVGDGYGRHIELAGAGKQLFDIGQSVKDRVLGMDVQMNE